MHEQMKQAALEAFFSDYDDTVLETKENIWLRAWELATQSAYAHAKIIVGEYARYAKETVDAHYRLSPKPFNFDVYGLSREKIAFSQELEMKMALAKGEKE